MKIATILFLVFLTAALAGCNKKEFLEAKPDTDLFIPSTLDEFQALLDNDPIMNETPVLGELSADNFYLPNTFWQGLNPKEKNAYVWHSQTFEGLTGDIADWNAPYRQVFYANVILEGLDKIAVNTGNAGRWKAVKGAALFARAYAFYNAAQIFAPVYSNTPTKEKWGIPLRLSAGVDEPSVRATVPETYDKIITDLKEAAALLPAEVPPVYRNRSSRPAAFALLSRVYLSMDHYAEAKLYADSCLQLYAALIDYNTLNVQMNFPFDKFNAETIYQSRFVTTNVLRAVSVANCIVDSNLYRSYAPNDLRDSIFYVPNRITGAINPKGGYAGGFPLFTGLATDELYLIRAECAARTGNRAAALNDLNTLLVNRWRTNTFVPFTAADDKEALRIILTERRKELPFRGLRWTDLRRYNKTDSSIVLLRKLNGDTHQLPARDLRYTLLLPPDVMRMSNMAQNPR